MNLFSRPNIFRIVLLFIIMCQASYAQLLENPFQDYQFHEPKYFIDIIMNSKIKYMIIVDSTLSDNEFVLNKESYSQSPINPYYNIEVSTDGSISLVLDFAPDNVRNVFDSAEAIFKERYYSKALSLYEKVTELAPQWFKGWAYMADCYYHLQEFENAEKYFLKALELNEIGYQEHFFLADAYHAMNKPEKALEHISVAFAINRNSSNIKASFDRILNANSLNYKQNRLSYKAKFSKTNDSACEIRLGSDAPPSTMFMMFCYAVWEMEPEFTSKMKLDSINGKITKIKEILITKAVSINAMQENNEEITKEEKLFFEALNEGYLDAIIYWDILAIDHPKVVLLLPKELKKKIKEYILKYCVEKVNSERIEK